MSFLYKVFIALIFISVFSVMRFGNRGNHLSQIFKTLHEATTPSGKQYEICMMTRIRAYSTMTSCNFIEWLEYHMAIGIDQFYIVDDCSDASSIFSETLKYYSTTSQVNVVPYHTVDACRPDTG